MRLFVVVLLAACCLLLATGTLAAEVDSQKEVLSDAAFSHELASFNSLLTEHEESAVLLETASERGGHGWRGWWRPHHHHHRAAPAARAAAAPRSAPRAAFHAAVHQAHRHHHHGRRHRHHGRQHRHHRGHHGKHRRHGGRHHGRKHRHHGRKHHRGGRKHGKKHHRKHRRHGKKGRKHHRKGKKHGKKQRKQKKKSSKRKAAARAYVESLYNSLLCRHSEPAGLNGWVHHLVKGKKSHGWVRRQFLSSPEYRSRHGRPCKEFDVSGATAYVENLYHTLLCRHSEPAGLNAWVNALRAGQTPAAVRTSFLNSPEYQSRGGEPCGAKLQRASKKIFGAPKPPPPAVQPMVPPPTTPQPQPLDAPVVPTPKPLSWCDRHRWMASAHFNFRIRWEVRCLTQVPAPPHVPKPPVDAAARVDWCQENASMKTGNFAAFYYQKCGGQPPKPPAPEKPASIPTPPPKEDRADWCEKFAYVRLTKNRDYYCTKCSSNCEEKMPPPPPRPAGVPAAPRAPEDLRSWCEKNAFMQYGHHAEYYFVKCGGSPPKELPKRPANVPKPPPEADRKPWCVEYNFLRYDPANAAYFYRKCGGIIPATPKPAPTCPSFFPAVDDQNRADVCAKFDWMRVSIHKPCYCSKCSCGHAVPPPVASETVATPPPQEKRAAVRGWCEVYSYMRYGAFETYYCVQCGCTLPAKPLPDALPNIAPAPKEAQAWCDSNAPLRYRGGVEAVYYYSKCGVPPKVQPPKPENVPTPPASPVALVDWCEDQKAMLKTANRHYYCSKCRCPMPPLPSKRVKVDADFCETNLYMKDDPKQSAFYYSKCGGAPKAPLVDEPKPEPIVAPVVAPTPVTITAGDQQQVHVHVNVAAPKVKQSNAGLQAMITRVTKKNTEAADKMEAILNKLKSQDCAGGNCLPRTHKEMEQWKADWVLETEETGSIVP